MQKIFCKSTEKRRRKFQIYTSIIQDEGKKYVIKEAVYEDGKAHISTIYNNYNLLSEVHPGKVVKCAMEKDRIVFPYLDGVMYEKILCDIIRSSISDIELEELLKEWKQLLIGGAENIVEFDNSEQFQILFGNGEQLLGDKALRITNFDCIADNIVMTQHGVCFIDYEWVFDFPIPIDFCFYRLIKIFFLKHKDIVSFERLLKAAGIVDDAKASLYEKLIDHFDMYISYDEQLDIIYANLGKLFKESRILDVDKNEKKKFAFPHKLIKDGSRIILYGAGDVGCSYYSHLQDDSSIQLIAWVDKKYEQYLQRGFDVVAVDQIDKLDFDYILLAIYNDKVAHDIMLELEQRGVAKERIIWEKPQYL